MLTFAVGHGANQRDVLHGVGDVSPAFGDLNVADGRGDGFGRTAVIRAGPGIKSFKLARSAAHEKQNASHAALPSIIGMKRHSLLPAQKASPARSKAYMPPEAAA